MVNLKRCTACGAPNPVSGVRCYSCGSALPVVAAQPRPGSPGQLGRSLRQLWAARKWRILILGLGGYIALVLLLVFRAGSPSARPTADDSEAFVVVSGLAVLFCALIPFVALGYITGYISKSRGRPLAPWWIAGIVCFPIATAVALLLKDMTQRPCAFCADWMSINAVGCPHCGRSTALAPTVGAQNAPAFAVGKPPGVWSVIAAVLVGLSSLTAITYAIAFAAMVFPAFVRSQHETQQARAPTVQPAFEPPAAPQSPQREIQIVNHEFTFTESNSVWSRLSWKVTLRNTDPAHGVNATMRVQYLDAQRFELGGSWPSNVHLNPGEQRIFTDSDLVDADVAPRIETFVTHVTGPAWDW